MYHDRFWQSKLQKVLGFCALTFTWCCFCCDFLPLPLPPLLQDPDAPTRENKHLSDLDEVRLFICISLLKWVVVNSVLLHLFRLDHRKMTSLWSSTFSCVLEQDSWRRSVQNLTWLTLFLSLLFVSLSPSNCVVPFSRPMNYAFSVDSHGGLPHWKAGNSTTIPTLGKVSHQ